MVDDFKEHGRLADANLAHTWTRVGQAMGAATGRSDSAVFVATGYEDTFFNGVYTTGPVVDADAVVTDAIAFMSEQRVPWLLKVREGVDDALLDAGRRAGLTDAGEPPGMMLASIGPSPEPPGELEVEVVHDDAGADAGIYNVATPPEHRRRGYGAAVTWAAIQEGALLGCDHAILQASQLGAAVYRNMGFVDIGHYVQLEGPRGDHARGGTGMRIRSSASTMSPSNSLPASSAKTCSSS